VDSRPGEGSSFVLRVPAPVVDAADRAADASAADTWKPRPSWRVLVVEDTLEHQKLVFAILRRAGHSVDVCETGERALTLLREAEYRHEPYTVLVIDAHLPGLSGSQTVRAIREQGFRGPILGWTADETEETRAACLLAGCDDVILKPTDAPKLLSALSRLLHGPRTLGAA
jgi:DNA-binding response OmpR family regulator